MLSEKERNRRVRILTKLGLKFDGQQFARGDFNVHHTEVTLSSVEEFNTIADNIKTEMERRERAKTT